MRIGFSSALITADTVIFALKELFLSGIHIISIIPDFNSMGRLDEVDDHHKVCDGSEL